MRRTTAGVHRSRCLRGRCCRWAPTPRGWRWACIRGSPVLRTSTTRVVWRSCSALATRTRAARTSRGATSGAPRIRRCPQVRAGSVAISIRCRVRSMPWQRGTRRAKHHGRFSPAYRVYRRFRTQAHTRSEARTEVRQRCKNVRRHRRWRAIRLPAVRISPT